MACVRERKNNTAATISLISMAKTEFLLYFFPPVEATYETIIESFNADIIYVYFNHVTMQGVII